MTKEKEIIEKLLTIEITQLQLTLKSKIESPLKSPTNFLNNCRSILLSKNPEYLEHPDIEQILVTETKRFTEIMKDSIAKVKQKNES